MFPGITKPFCNYLSVFWACTHFVSKFFISNEVSYPEYFSQINKNGLTPICKRLHCNVLVHSVPTSVSSDLRISHLSFFSSQDLPQYSFISQMWGKIPAKKDVRGIRARYWKCPERSWALLLCRTWQKLVMFLSWMIRMKWNTWKAIVLHVFLTL